MIAGEGGGSGLRALLGSLAGGSGLLEREEAFESRENSLRGGEEGEGVFESGGTCLREGQSWKKCLVEGYPVVGGTYPATIASLPDRFCHVVSQEICSHRKQRYPRSLLFRWPSSGTTSPCNQQGNRVRRIA